MSLSQGLPRVGVKDYESQRAKMYGPYDRWHHVECFAKQREELQYYDKGEAMAGFKTLSKEDQDLMREHIKEIKG